MVTASAYWRPQTLAEVLELLARPTAVVLGGGTRLNAATSSEQVEVVDLQALGLDEIRPEQPDVLRIGAMATLQQVVDSDLVPDVVREAARRERPSTLRAQGTLGGCVATGDGECELLAALLVHEAEVEVAAAGGTESVPLPRLLADLPLGRGKVVVAVSIRTDGVAAAERTARTPADRAIVAAYARDGELRRHVALTGVATTPVLVEPGEKVRPPGDFRGSSDYRQALAEVLVARVEEELS